MAQDNDQQVIEAAEFWQKLEAMVTTAEDTKKKAAQAAVTMASSFCQNLACGYCAPRTGAPCCGYPR
jgi:hypothetical protein